MIRIVLGIEYCGRDFNGWQTQDHGRTVQQTLEKALSIVADEDIVVQCAGRTDSGVHAIQQIIHFDTDANRPMHSWVLGGNVNLPADVSIVWAKQVDDDFHARFSALRRRYRYVILNRQARHSLFHKMVSCESRTLNELHMSQAAECLVGEHDFNAYRAVSCQAKSAVRTIYSIQLQRKSHFIIMDVEANAFLHHMVRNIAGVLQAIGMGKEDISWAQTVLETKDRTQGGITALADGLYLTGVEYGKDFAIPAVDASQWPLCL